ncbi:hypothetical protein SAMN05444521_6141 [Streptomyces sp. 3214.6]|nr:hypothetical protein SAMN05444521_6141 [Streptomyces sp. 3214.6]
MGGLREVAAPFVALGPSGVAIRTRLGDLTPEDEKVLRLVGAHLGSLASKDLKARCADGLEHSAETWAARKRELTGEASSRWAGSITKATHDQWALARRPPDHLLAGSGRRFVITGRTAGVHQSSESAPCVVGEQGVP